jgi:hypothetical protein
MRKTLSILSAIALSATAGCHSPLKTESKITTKDLRQRLSQNAYPEPEQKKHIEINPGREALMAYLERPNYLDTNQEPSSSNPAKVLLATTKELYFETLIPGDPLYKPYEFFKQLSSGMEDFRKQIFGDRIHLNIKISENSARVTLSIQPNGEPEKSYDNYFFKRYPASETALLSFLE